MRMEMFGGGLPSKSSGQTRSNLPLSDAVTNIGAYRVGGLGDGLIATAQIVAAKRRFSPKTIMAFGDLTTIRTLRYGTAEFSSQKLAGSYYMRNEQKVREQMAMSYDLWLDLKPVPIVRGRKAKIFVNDAQLVADLEDLDRGYFGFQGDRIRDVYRKYGCVGQLDIMNKAYGVEGSMTDARIPLRQPAADRMDVPRHLVTISAGYDQTSVYKSWPAERWSEICHFLSDLGICPIQIGLSGETQIDGALSASHLTLEEQMWLISKADAHLGSDGFLCHVATALGTKTAVLWGPTPHEVWGHPEQTHILSPAEGNVWWTHFHWAWDERCVNSMRAISIDQVLEAVTSMLGQKEA